MNKYIAIIIAILFSIFGVFGDYFINLAGESKKYIIWRWFLIGLIVYGSTAIGWFFAMKHIKLATLGVVYTVTTAIGLAIVGALFFHEKISPIEIFAIILAIIALLLMAKFS